MSDVPLRLSQPPQQTQTQQQITQQVQEQIIQEKIKEAFVQTDYRDSQTQTEPYTPAHIIRTGDNPEILSLQHLQWQKGLPASIEELENIEWNREKIWFDNALPPISDEASFQLRRKLMQEQEVREWRKKENEIRKVQNEKLYLLQSALSEREKDVEERNAQRIEEIKIKKTENKNRLVAKIQRKKIKVLRKMMKSRKELENESKGRDIIEEYANYASKVYAGITRDGLSLDKIANKYEVQPVALTSYQGITELANNIHPKYLQTNVNVVKLMKQIEKNYARLETYHKGELKKAQQKIEGRSTKDEQQEEIQDLNKFSLNKMKVRPPTPTWKYE